MGITSYLGVFMFKNRFIELRKEKKLSQKAIAENIRIGLRSYQRYEYGERKPDSDVLLAVAEYYNVSVDYLLGRTDNPEVNK